MSPFTKGQVFRGKTILDFVQLSSGWIILKTEDGKSAQDFRVRTVYQLSPRVRSYTPKHAHFAIDFYGKLCADTAKGREVLDAITGVWKREPVDQVVSRYEPRSTGLPGYSVEYILYGLNWILEQEDVNFAGRPEPRQKELDETLGQLQLSVPPGRLGSQLAISLFCNITLGQHPVDAFIRANLDVLPIRRTFRTV